MTTQIEFQHFVIPITENVQEELKKLLEAGWTVVPGATPIAVWHMQRLQQDGLMTRAGVSVKEEGITIIRGSGGDASKIN